MLCIPGAVGMPFPGVKVSIVAKSEHGDGFKTLVSADSNKVTITPGMQQS